MNDLTTPTPARKPDAEALPEPAAPVQSPAVLDYAPPAKRSLPKWFTRPLTPGTAAIIWTVSSIALRFVDARILNPHLAIGLALCTVAKVVSWPTGWVWKVQALVALAMLAVGAELFLAPWRMWGYSPSYWTVYNQTYIYNYDASLRVMWVPLLALAWLVSTAIGARWSNRSRRRHFPLSPVPRGEGTRASVPSSLLYVSIRPQDILSLAHFLSRLNNPGSTYERR